MQKAKKFAYELASFVFGMVLMVSFAAAIFAHLQLGKLDSPAGQVALLISEDARAEKELMETVRIVASIASVAAVALTVAVSKPYYESHDDPIWEVKKGLAGGALILPFGLAGYLLMADNFPKSMALSLAIMGLVVLLSNTGYFFYYSNRSAPAESRSGSFCADCGDSVSGSDSFCPSCGSEL